MKISFEQNSNQIKREYGYGYEKPQTVAKSARGNAIFQMDGRERVGLPEQEKGLGAEDIRSSAANMNLESRQDGLIVASNTMSDEDYARMLEEGYEPSEMTPEETVTILDKIKAELIKSGKHIAGYTDDMDIATLTAAVGSQGLAQSLQNAFGAADIPLTEENAEKALQALAMAQSLHTPTEGELYHMLSGGMDITIQELYLAQASAAKAPAGTAGQYFGEAVKGYVTRNVENGPVGGDMDAQIEQLLGKLGVEHTEESMGQAKWLLEKGLAITKESMAFLEDMSGLSFPPAEEDVLMSAAAALADGKGAVEGDLVRQKSYVQQAVEIYEFYHGDNAERLIHDRRVLEEVRLHMTVETNLKLLESGFSIDTASMEETIEALKMAEESLAKQYFPGSDTAVESYRSLEKASQVIRNLPGLPFKTVADFAGRLAQVSVERFHEAGQANEAAYRQAGAAYETIGTAPRGDLGDSIQKAFGNVDVLLTELGYELNEENRKAMRGLAYNSMELSVENMEKIKEANRQVLEVVEKLTPAKTLEMIRDGYNPLEHSFEELNAYLDNQQADMAVQEEKYSRFLQRLDHTGAITEDEREAFIGCYRLMRQLEKADGAATGSIIRTGAELTFANLLSAVRSGKYKGMDAKVSDMVGAACERILKESSISDQIERAFAKQQRQDFAAANTDMAEAEQLLSQSGVRTTTENLLAAGQLLKESGKAAAEVEKRLAGKGRSNDKLQKLDKPEEFKAEYISELEELLEDVQEEVFAQTEAVDVKSLQLVSKQLGIMSGLGQRDEYFFGMEIQGEQVNIHLRMESSEVKAGLIEIRFTGEKLGVISGSLQVTDMGVEGFFVGNRKEVVRNLRESADIINNQVSGEWSLRRLEFVYSETEFAVGKMPGKATEVQYTTEQLYGLAKDFLQAVKATGENGGILDEN